MDLEHSTAELSTRGKLSALQRQESCLFNLSIGQSGSSFCLILPFILTFRIIFSITLIFSLILTFSFIFSLILTFGLILSLILIFSLILTFSLILNLILIFSLIFSQFVI